MAGPGEGTWVAQPESMCILQQSHSWTRKCSKQNVSLVDQSEPNVEASSIGTKVDQSRGFKLSANHMGWYYIPVHADFPSVPKESS